MRLAERIAERREQARHVIHCPEWGDDDAPLAIYSAPITAGDINRLQKRHKGFLDNMTVEGMIDLIIMKAEDQDGKKIFTLEDKPILMRETVGVIADVAGKMFAGIESVEDHEKN